MIQSLEAEIIPAAISIAAHEEPDTGLVGHLNALDITLAALAYAGPLAGTAGYAALLIGEGNGLGTPSAFFAVMVILLFFAVGYGALTKHVPYPGAFYAYITAGLGRAAGLGSSFLILGSYFAIGVGVYAFSGLSAKHMVEGLGGPVLDWWVYGLLFWGAVSTLAYFHVALSAKVLGVLLIAEVLAIFFFDVIVMSSGGKEGISLEPFTWQAFSSGNLGVSLIFAMALFSGFEATAIYREETRDPDKTIPRATIMVVLFIGLFYTLSSWALITGLGTSQAVRLSSADPAGAFFTVAKEFCGPLFFHITSALILTSMFAADLAIQNVTTRYTYSLAVDGIFPKCLSVAHNRHHSPHRASVAVAGIYFLLTAAMTFLGLTAQQLYAWFAGVAAFSIICAMAITSLATVVFFHRERVAESVWRTTIAPTVALIGLSGMVVLGFHNFPSLIGGSRFLANIMSASCLLLFVLGFIAALWLKKNRPDIYLRIGRQ